MCVMKRAFSIPTRKLKLVKKLYMGNAATAYINGVGVVVHKMTSGKDVEIKDVLYVPKLRKNLVSVVC